MNASLAQASAASDAPSPRHRLIVATSVALLVLAGMVATVFWSEAEKEVRILCGLMTPSTPAAEVTRILGTANRLEVKPAGVDPAVAPALTFDAPANLRSSRCEVALADGRVTTAEFTEDYRLQEVAAVLAGVLLLVLVGFQIGLATGRISGRMAWGGVHETLPPALRRASAFSAVMLVAVGWVLFEHAGITGLLPGTAIAETGAWAVVLLFTLSAVGNLASSSRPERRFGIPMTAALLLLSFAVAYAG